MKSRSLFSTLVLVLAMLACNLPSNVPITETPTVLTPSPTLFVPSQTPTQTPLPTNTPLPTLRNEKFINSFRPTILGEQEPKHDYRANHTSM